MLEVIFSGRVAGAIGINYDIIEWVENDPRIDEEACRLELYNKYDHISNIRIAEDRYKKFMI